MKPFRIILMLILIACTAFSSFQGSIAVKSGKGYDGVAYVLISQKFGDEPYETVKDGLSNYYIQRILPCIVVAAGLKAMGAELSDRNVILGFKWLNILCIILAVFAFWAISDHFGFQQNIEIIGFSSLFFCFPLLKLSQYCPALTDIPAFLIGLFLLYSWLSEKPWPTYLAILLGSITFPNFSLFFVLMFFHRTPLTPISTHWLGDLKSLALALIFLALLVFIYSQGNLFLYEDITYNVTPILQSLLVPSIAVTLGYLLWVGQLLRNFSFMESFSQINWLYAVISVSLFLGTKLLMGFLSFEGGLTATNYLTNIINQSITFTGNFWVAHFVYFGPVVLLALIFFRELGDTIYSYGYGLAVLFVIMGFFSIGSESRQLINFLPFLVVFLCRSLQYKKRITNGFAVVYSVVCVVMSRFWYDINQGIDAMPWVGDAAYSFLEYPLRAYFMFFGPWVSFSTYTLHLLTAVIALGTMILYFNLSNKSRTHGAAPKS